jgi:hypothetical protein
LSQLTATVATAATNIADPTLKWPAKNPVDLPFPSINKKPSSALLQRIDLPLPSTVAISSINLPLSSAVASQFQTEASVNLPLHLAATTETTALKASVDLPLRLAASVGLPQHPTTTAS